MKVGIGITPDCLISASPALFSNMEKPSDIQGLIYIPFVNDVEDGKVTLAKEMEKQGLKISVTRL